MTKRVWFLGPPFAESDGNKVMGLSGYAARLLLPGGSESGLYRPKSCLAGRKGLDLGVGKLEDSYNHHISSQNSSMTSITHFLGGVS